MKEAVPENIELRIPVVINYVVLESLLKKRLAGEYFQTEKQNGQVTKYAKILDISLRKSSLEGYDLEVDLKFQNLTALYRNREGHLVFHAALSFDKGKEEVSVDYYKLQVESNSWILDKILQTIANKFIYKKLKSKMAVEFRPIIREKLNFLNEKLQDRFEASEGIFLSGSLDKFKILKFIPGSKEIFVLIELEGETLIEVQRLKI